MNASNKLGKLIVIANVKGGTGKSTIAVNLAAIAASQGKTALIIDTDSPQFNAASWYNARVLSGKEDVNCTQITTPTIQVSVKNDLKFYDYVIVDSGARDTDLMRSAMMAAGVHKGLLLIPLTTSWFDLWATNDTLNLLREAKTMMEINAYFFLNRIITGTNLEKEFTELLNKLKAEHSMTSLKTNIYQRVELINCLKEGSAAFENKKNGKAASELTALFIEINTILNALHGE